MKCLFGLVESCDVIDFVISLHSEAEKGELQFSSADELRQLAADVLSNMNINFIITAELSKCLCIAAFCLICPYRLKKFADHCEKDSENLLPFEIA